MSEALPDVTRRSYIKQIKDLEALAYTHRAEITMLNGVVARKNLELDALHFVWCSGACGKKLTRAIVEEAIRNTNRLIEKFNGQHSNGVWRTLCAEDQAALLEEWKSGRHVENDLRNHIVVLQRDIAELRRQVTSHPAPAASPPTTS